MENCKHKKVYSSYILLSMPLQRPWICSTCGEKGTSDEDSTISCAKHIYEGICKKFHKIKGEK